MLRGLSNVVSLAASEWFSMALRADGSVTQWSTLLTSPTNMTDAIAIAAGKTHSIAVKRSGQVVLSSGEPPPGLEGAIAVSAGENFSVAVLGGGLVVAWGTAVYGNPTVVPNAATDVVSIATGQYHNVALRSDGTVVCWDPTLIR